MNLKIIILFLCSVIGMSTVFAEQPIINNMIFFGDSLSDVGDSLEDLGNNTWILMDGGNVGAPITNLNEQKRKYLWVNYLVEENLNKPVYPSRQPGLSPFNDSISYAYASADTSDNYLNTDWPQENTPVSYINKNCIQAGAIKDANGKIKSTCTPGLVKQVETYLNDVQYKPSQQTLFFIWAGANDLLSYYSADMANRYSFFQLFKFHLPEKIKLEGIEQKAVDNIMMAKKILMDAGVKADRIYILDLPDFSKTPAILAADNLAFDIDSSRKKDVEKSLSDMSKDFNQKLRSQQSVEEKYVLPPSHYLPIADLFNKMLSHPKDYGLSHTGESCVAKKALSACTGYLFYNDRHPTTTAHKIIADNIQAIKELSIKV